MCESVRKIVGRQINFISFLNLFRFHQHNYYIYIYIYHNDLITSSDSINIIIIYIYHNDLKICSDSINIITIYVP